MYAGGGFFLGTLGYLGTPLRERFVGTFSSLNDVTLGTCLFTVPASFRGPHITIKLFDAFKICKVDKNVIRK